MKTKRAPDPVDLMLDGRFEDAARAYVSLYIDALQRADFAIGPDLLMGLHYCVAGMTGREPSSADVEQAVRAQLTARKVKVDRRVLDQLQVATSMVKKGRQRAERSVAGVESDKERRWEGE
jgi:hypothetical protein